MITRPVLRYFGGKYRIAKWIISNFPEHKIYVEPYGGAASVLMQKRRSWCEIYNDLDSEIFNVFQILRDKDTAYELIRQLTLTTYSRDEFKNAYVVDDGDSSIEKARKTIVKSFMGTGSNAIFKQSGFRMSDPINRGQHTVNDFLTYIPEVSKFIKRLEKVVIENRPALDIIKRVDRSEALFYVDPPYLKSTRTVHGKYNHEMDLSEHYELAEVLNSIKGKACVSGYRSELYDELYKDWVCLTHKAETFGGGQRIECIWMNYQPGQMRMF